MIRKGSNKYEDTIIEENDQANCCRKYLYENIAKETFMPSTFAGQTYLFMQSKHSQVASLIQRGFIRFSAKIAAFRCHIGADNVNIYTLE